MSHIKKSLFTALAFFSFIGQANAGITYNFGSALVGSQLETFDELTLGSTGTFSLPDINSQLVISNGEIIKGTSVNHYATPYQDTTQYVALDTAGTAGTATFSFSKPTNYFALDWGSVDTYNTLSFYHGNTLLGTVTGQEIITAAGLTPGNQGAQGTVYANFNSTSTITKVVAAATGIAFEFDNVRVAAVPLPASLPLFGAALMALGVFNARKKWANA